MPKYEQQLQRAILVSFFNTAPAFVRGSALNTTIVQQKSNKIFLLYSHSQGRLSGTLFISLSKVQLYFGFTLEFMSL